MEVIVWLTALILITSVSQVVVSLQCLKSVLWLHTAYTTILHLWTLRVLSEGSGTNRLLWREFSNPIGIDIFYQIILCPEGLTCSLNASISPCHDTWKLLQILTDVHERANSLFGKHCGEWWSRIWGSCFQGSRATAVFKINRWLAGCSGHSWMAIYCCACSIGQLVFLSLKLCSSLGLWEATLLIFLSPHWQHSRWASFLVLSHFLGLSVPW